MCGANATGSRVVQGEEFFVCIAPGAVDAWLSEVDTAGGRATRRSPNLVPPTRRICAEA